MRLFCEFKDLLAVVRHLLPAMHVVESDQVGQRSHVRVSKRCEVLCDLRLKFIQQRSELVVGIFEYVTCIAVDDGCTQAFHHFQCVLCKTYRRLIARNAAPVVTIIEIAKVASDPRALQCAASQEPRIVIGQGLTSYATEGRLQYVEKNCNVGHAPPHWPSRVLLMGNRNNTLLRNEAESR